MIRCLGRRLFFSAFSIMLVFAAFEFLGGPRVLESVNSWQGIVIKKDALNSVLTVAPVKAAGDSVIDKVLDATGVNSLSYFLSEGYSTMLDGIEVGDVVEVTEKKTKSVLMGTKKSESSVLMSAQKRK